MRWLLIVALSGPIALTLFGAAGAQETTLQPGTISGVVFHDRNANGVRDPGEEGLPGILIELLQEPIGKSEVLQATTNDAGNYSIEGGPGSFVVAFYPNQTYPRTCSTVAFSYNPFPPTCFRWQFPWTPTTTQSLVVQLDSGARVDFGATPVDIALIGGSALFETSPPPPRDADIEALVNGKSCARVSAASTYIVEVLGDREQPGCAKPGDVVTFTVAGVPALQTFVYREWFAQPGVVAPVDLFAMHYHAWYWFQTTGTSLPKSGTFVRAVIDGNVCGQTSIESRTEIGVAGFSHLIVPSAQLRPGCGRPGAKVSFLVDGVPVGGPVDWEVGVQRIDLVLPAANPVLPAPIGLPPTGGGNHDTADVWALSALVAIGILALLARSYVVKRS